MDTYQLEILRDKVYKLLSEYHTLHLLICKQLESPSEELHKVIINKIDKIKEIQ